MNRRTPTTDVALVAGFAALIAVCALLPEIKTGVGVPYSLQTSSTALRKHLARGSEAVS